MRYETVLEKMCTIKYLTEASEYNIMFNLDQNLFNPMLVLLYSFVKNCTKKINLFVFQNGFSYERKVQLKDYCDSLSVSVIIYDIDNSEFEIFGKTRCPRPVYYYYKSPQLLPLWVDRALHIDIDAIVLNDIGRFYNVDFENNWLAATNEYNFPFFNTYFRDSINKDFKYRPIYSSENIYNAGVLLLNIKKFRESNISLSKFSMYRKKEDALTFLDDQILMNRFTGTDIKLFPKPYYNCWVAYSPSSIECFKKPMISNEVYQYFKLDSDQINTIIHYTAYPHIKPWYGIKAIENGEYIFASLDQINYPSHSANLEVDNFVRIWWEYAKHIPRQNYIELVANSIEHNIITSVNKEKKKGRLGQLELYSAFLMQLLGMKLHSYIDSEGSYIQFPLSADGRLHYEFWFLGEEVHVALHFEGGWGTQKNYNAICQDIISRSELKEPLTLIDHGYVKGLAYVLPDTTYPTYIVELMVYLIRISWPILEKRKLISDKFLLPYLLSRSSD